MPGFPTARSVFSTTGIATASFDPFSGGHLFIAPEFTDAELTKLGVAEREPGQTRSERRAVEATKTSINAAPTELRIRFLRALLGDRFPVVQARAVSAGAGVEHLLLQVPMGSPAPDLVVGYPSQDSSGTATFVVLAVIEHKRFAYDNVHESRDPLPKSWQASWITGSGQERTGAVVYQCDGYRGDPARWLSGQPERSWRLNDGQVGEVEWLLVCEYERNHVPDGWIVLPWAQLVSAALSAIREGSSGAQCASPLLREWIAPAAERLYYIDGSRPFGSLRAAAIRAWRRTRRVLPTAIARAPCRSGLPAAGWS